MFYAKDVLGNIIICARCGATKEVLTKDHFVPRSCRMRVNEEGNYVAVCEECNKEKANRIVPPNWYEYLGEEQKNKLFRYMKYARSFILTSCEDKEILELVRNL